MSFIQLTSSLVLHADPVLPAHAVTKQYVDNQRNNLAADAFTKGVIDANRLPSLSGDVTSLAGSNTVELIDTGVTPGSYAKVTVNSSGRVVSGAALTSSDVPSVPWEKITTGKPTTAAGYGITNVIPLSGGTSSGAIVSTATPTESLHAITKGYVDSLVTGVVSGSLAVGDVIRKPMGVGHVGFLRCNGGVVSKALYTGLYAVVADKYNTASVPGNGMPWNQQALINREDSVNFTGWSTGNALPIGVSHSQAFVTKERAYLVGGSITSGYTDAIYTTTLNPDGSLASWNTSNPLPKKLGLAKGIVTKNRAFLFGGVTDSGVTNSVMTATIDAEGTLGSWSDTQSVRSDSLSGNGSVVIPQGVTKVTVTGKGADGGNPSTSQSRTLTGVGVNNLPFSSTPYGMSMVGKGGDGGPLETGGKPWCNLNSFDTSTNNTLGAFSNEFKFADKGFAYLSPLYSVVTEDKVYIFGTNYSASFGVDSSGDLTTGSAVTSLPIGSSVSSPVIHNNKAYVLGGFDIVTSRHSNVVHYANVINGVIGTWTYTTPLPIELRDVQTVIINNQIYVISGSTASGYSPYIYRSTIAQNGTLGSWVTVSNNTPVTPGASLFVIKNKLYAVGGQGGDSTARRVLSTVIGSGSFLTTWTTEASLPLAPPTNAGFFITKERIYIPSGVDMVVGYVNSSGDITGWYTIQNVINQGYVNGIFLLKNTVYMLTTNGYHKASFNTGFNSYEPYYNGTGVKGRDTTVTVAGTVYTFPGGQGGPAVDTSLVTGTLPATTATSYSHDVASGKDVTLWFSTTVSTKGADTILLINGQTYTFLGGLGGPADQTTMTATVPGTSALTGTHTVPASGLLSVSYVLEGGAGNLASSLPTPVKSAQAFVTKNRVYVLGGTSSSVVYSSTIKFDGTLEGWSTDNPLPVTVSNSHVVVTGNRVYLLGGLISGVASSAVYTAGIQDDGTLGTWSSATALPVTVRDSQVWVTKDKVYLLGGLVNNTASGAVYVSTINSDGTLGTWTTGTSIPSASSGRQSIVTKNKLHLLGGVSGSTYYTTVNTVTVTGGLNDYSDYYKAIQIPVDPSNFKLPDFSSKETDGVCYYIKY